MPTGGLRRQLAARERAFGLVDQDTDETRLRWRAAIRAASSNSLDETPDCVWRWLVPGPVIDRRPFPGFGRCPHRPAPRDEVVAVLTGRLHAFEQGVPSGLTACPPTDDSEAM
jgi:hypothetical protein